MLILPQEIEIKWNYQSKEWYESKGYIFTKYNSKFKVNVLDLSKGCTKKINVLCNYCLEEGIETEVQKTYQNYIASNKNGVIHKDCCKKCQQKKNKESNLLKYGVTNVNQLECENKYRLSNINRITEDIILNLLKSNNLTPINFNYNSQHDEFEFICDIHKELGIQKGKYISILRGHTPCKKCAFKSISGENHYEWKGGISPLHEYLRGKLLPWKIDSFKYFNHKCIITNKKKDSLIHHLYPFYEILQKVLQDTGLPLYNQINNYSEKELYLLELKCLELHYKYGLGVCINKKIHDEFHSIYGLKNFTPEDFHEFYKIKTNKEFQFDLVLQ